MTSIRLLTRRQVEQACGLSRSTIYRKMREGTFPEPIRIGVRAVRWPAHELEDWLVSLPRATGDHDATSEALWVPETRPWSLACRYAGRC